MDQSSARKKPKPEWKVFINQPLIYFWPVLKTVAITQVLVMLVYLFFLVSCIMFLPLSRRMMIFESHCCTEKSSGRIIILWFQLKHVKCTLQRCKTNSDDVSMMRCTCGADLLRQLRCLATWRVHDVTRDVILSCALIVVRGSGISQQHWWWLMTTMCLKTVL